VIGRVIIVGGAGRDGHNFDGYFKGNTRYRVIAFDTLGDSLPSTVVNATTQAVVVVSARKVIRSPRYGLTRKA
jgi:hypothetical protein